MAIKVITFLFLLLFINFCSNTKNILRTDCGNYIGHSSSLNNTIKINEYRGIPYAKPPIKNLRWKPSKLVGCRRNKILNTGVNPNACLQMSNTFKIPISEQSEDCLYLNIFSRQNNSTDLKPVIFWIHGGSVVIGSVNTYGPIENLLMYDDVVIVAINYRLNVFGFLALEELANHDPRGTSGNYGITDQLTALRWVQKNIAHFGGDPKRVTLFGQSSGGTSILALLSAPDSKGLFAGVVSLSASPNITMDIATAQTEHKSLFLEKSPCIKAHDIYNCLLNLSAEQLVKLIPPSFEVDGAFPSNPKGSGFTGLVVVDGKTVTLPIEEALKNSLIDVPLYMTILGQELSVFPNKTILEMNAVSFRNFMLYNFKQFPQIDNTNLGEYLYLYYKRQSKEPNYIYSTLDSDIEFTCGHIHLAKLAGKSFKSPVYMAMTTQRPSHPVPHPEAPLKLAFHIWDYMTIFNVNYVPFFYGEHDHPNFIFEESDLMLGETLRSEIFDMVKYGRVKRSGLREFKSAHSFPNNFNMGLHLFGKTQNSLNHKKEICRVLESKGIDKRFWIAN